MDISSETINHIIGIVLVVFIFYLFFSFDFDLKINMPYAGCKSKTADLDRLRIAQSQQRV